MTNATILCLNSGSSSLKFALIDDHEVPLARGAVERIGRGAGRAWIHHGAAQTERAADCADHAAALALAFTLMAEQGVPAPTAIGQRVVHGGRAHVRPSRVDDALVAALTALVPLAPLHLPAALAGIAAASARYPGVPQIACFDTAFHATLPEVAWRLPLPERYPEVRRYGFHGLSYESVLLALGDEVPARMVVAHLGSGASLAAIRDGRSVDTTMGMTPAGGIIMGTRCGDLDPGVWTYLAREKGLSADELQRLVEEESGLLALGGYADMGELLARRPTDARAALAVEAFVYSVRKAIGAYVAVLGGIDLLVFTGGIGEHAAAVRGELCRGLGVFGIALDEARNEGHAGVLSTVESRCVVRVIPADEERVIARGARGVVGRGE